MAKNTWLKLWRSTAKNSLIRNAKASQLFLWMLLEAQWKNKREGGVDLKPGELLTSMPLIQIELNMSKKQARDAIALLESLRIVAHDRDFEGRGLGRGKKTIYRFINWSKYQSQTEEGHESVPPEGTSQFLEAAQVEENFHTEQADSSPKNLKKKEVPSPAKAVANKNFMEVFCTAWANRAKGTKYIVTARDGQRLKILLQAGLELERWRLAVPAYLNSTDTWIRSQGFPMWALCDNFNLYGAPQPTPHKKDAL